VSEVSKLGHVYVSRGFVSSYTFYLCQDAEGAELVKAYRGRMRLARHMLASKPYAWRSIAAEALNDAAYIRRVLTSGRQAS